MPSADVAARPFERRQGACLFARRLRPQLEWRDVAHGVSILDQRREAAVVERQVVADSVLRQAIAASASYSADLRLGDRHESRTRANTVIEDMACSSNRFRHRQQAPGKSVT